MVATSHCHKLAILLDCPNRVLLEITSGKKQWIDVVQMHLLQLRVLLILRIILKVLRIVAFYVFSRPINRTLHTIKLS